VHVPKQFVVRAHWDTPYTFGVFDLPQPVTIVKPDTAERALENIDQQTRCGTYSCPFRGIAGQSANGCPGNSAPRCGATLQSNTEVRGNK
jgi:hypothetical protein